MNPYSSVDDELEARVRLARARMDQIARENDAPRPSRFRQIITFLHETVTLLSQCILLVTSEIITNVRIRLT